MPLYTGQHYGCVKVVKKSIKYFQTVILVSNVIQ